MTMISVHSTDAPLLRRYLAFENLAAGDPRRVPGMRLPNRPLYRTQLVDDEAWYGSLIYRQVYAPPGLDDTLGAYLINQTSRLALGLGFARELGSERFDESDAERLQPYVPHLRCATRVMTQRIAEASTAASLIGSGSTATGLPELTRPPARCAMSARRPRSDPQPLAGRCRSLRQPSRR